MLKSPFEPCIPSGAKSVPDGPAWIHEIKHDGYRLIVQRDGKTLRLWTRNGHDWSDRFPRITEAALRNRNSTFVKSTAFRISTACTAGSKIMRSSSTPSISM